MNIAFIMRSVIFLPLQSLLHWWTTSGISTARSATLNRDDQIYAPKKIAEAGVLTRARAQISAQQKPLRVLRVVETGQAGTSVGRMVISGRMADVCAELDRLVARETAPS